MRAQCSICSEVFTKTSELSATMCGHVFHQVCLLQWLNRMWTCPTCRNKLTHKTIAMKLFLDPIDEDSQIDEEELRNKNNELDAQLKSAKHELASLYSAIDIKCSELDDAERNAKTLTSELGATKVKCQMYKTRLHCAEALNRSLKATESELVAVRKELDNYTKLQSMLEGTASRTEEILNSYSKDPASMKQLATYCSLLQKELTDVKTAKAKISDELKTSKRDSATLRFNITKKDASMMTLTSENAALKESLEAVEQELESTQKKMEHLHRKFQDISNSPNTSIDRFILESPAPQKNVDSFLPSLTLKKRDKISGSSKLKRRANENVSAKAVPDMTSTIVDLEELPDPFAPQPPPPPPVIDLSPSSSEDSYQNFTIFKRLRAASSSSSMASDRKLDRGYDGYGGHSKPDVYPTSKRVSTKSRPKQTKSKTTNTITNFLN